MLTPFKDMSSTNNAHSYRSRTPDYTNKQRSKLISVTNAVLDNLIAWTVNAANAPLLQRLTTPHQLFKLCRAYPKDASNRTIKVLWHVGRSLKRLLWESWCREAKKSITCKICEDLDIDTAANRGHVYCGLCLASCRRQNQVCPFCRKEISETWRLYL